MGVDPAPTWVPVWGGMVGAASAQSPRTAFPEVGRKSLRRGAGPLREFPWAFPLPNLRSDL